MTERNRDYLKQEFQDGERPSGNDFADLIDSYLCKIEDGVQVAADNTLVLTGGVGLGDSDRAEAGTLRLNGNAVQFHDGTDWVTLGSGGGGAFQAVGGGGDVAYGDGNVGIGPFPAAPTFRLDVDLEQNTGTDQQVRFGNLVCSNGSGSLRNDGLVAHRNHSDNTGYALRQRPSGEVRVNAPAGQRIRLETGGNSTRLAVSNTGSVIVNGSSNLPGAGDAVLQVQGTAFKSTPGGQWATPSDARVKDDIQDLDAGLAELARVRPVSFRYNGRAGTEAGRRGVGIVGQEVEQIFPDAVTRVPTGPQDGLGGEDMLAYDGSALPYVLVKAVQELAAKVEHLEEALAQARGTEVRGSDAQDTEEDPS
ncbi:MAG: tail fiber domain-containing protein [Acidobacteriota bacterium]